MLALGSFESMHTNAGSGRSRVTLAVVSPRKIA